MNPLVKWRSTFSIAGKKVGKGTPIFVIAEAGSNHDGDYQKACQLIAQAKWAGADAIKFQSFHADTLVNPKELPEVFQKLKSFELQTAWLPKLVKEAEKQKIIFFSTPFDATNLAALKKLDVPVYKIASGDLTFHSFLSEVARIGKPVILSTGMSRVEEIRKALDVMASRKNRCLVLMHCVTNYPASEEEMNLRAIPYLEKKFGCPVGFSDHTLSDAAALASVCLGACVIEKHFTLKRHKDGLDHLHSLEPEEFKQLVQKIRVLERMLGREAKFPQPSEMPKRYRARRGIYAKTDIPVGTKLMPHQWIALRPEKGMSTARLASITGKKTKTFLSALSPITSRVFR